MALSLPPFTPLPAEAYTSISSSLSSAAVPLNPSIAFLKGLPADKVQDHLVVEPCSGGQVLSRQLQAAKPGLSARIKLEAGGGHLETRFRWTSNDQLISCCNGRQLTESVEALDSLVKKGSYVDTTVFYRVLKRCIAQRDLLLGKRVHALCVESRYESNAFLANHIICMYASHGMLEEARNVFNKVTAPDCYVWASIISAHARHGQPAEAIRLYQKMRLSSAEPDNHVFVAILRACATAGNLDFGREVHADIQSSLVEPDMFLHSCLVDMYAKCGSLEDARRAFDRLPSRNVVTWTAMIAGYAEHGRGAEALTLYASMQQEGIAPNHFTYSSILKACASAGALHQGKQFHAQIQERGLEGNVVIGTCLVDMYAKCGRLQEARTVFDRLPARNVMTWNSMIAGYAQQGLGEEALRLYDYMLEEGNTPTDLVTFLGLLKACASVGALQKGKRLHTQIQARGLEGEVVVGNCLVDMYAKCGRLEDARRLFERLPLKNVVTWTALLNGYAENSDGRMAVKCFKDMQQQGVEPDGATFVCLLAVCSLQGLVSEGYRYFKMMVDDYGIVPTVSHYNCMVDLLGRSGHLDEAETMLQTLPFDNLVVGWRSLLSACKSYNDIERGRRCFDHIIRLEPESATAYVLLGNIYANAGRWQDVDRVESLRKHAGATKKPAKACIEVKNKVHEFTVGQDRADVSLRLKSMNSRLKDEGAHVPHTQLVLKTLPESTKEDALCGHAEKLALAYGLLNTPDGHTLLVTKNLRMCTDCHSATKIASRLEKRDIIVRDAHLVHHFVDGSCSCGDRHMI